MLFEHQKTGAAWLADRRRAYLGDKPGMGKTRTILAGLKQHACVLPRTLVVCPAVVRTHWMKEGLEAGFLPVAVLSYNEIASGGVRLMKELLGTGIDALVLDEAHFLKHASAQRTQLLLGPNGYARRIPTVWLASGTPVPRHPGELWTTVSSLFPELAVARGITTSAQWEERFCIKRRYFARGQWREKVVGLKDPAGFQEILDAILLQREPGNDVPPVWWQPLVLDGETLKLTESAPAALRAAVTRGESLEDLLMDPAVARYRRRIGECKVKPAIELLTHQLQGNESKIVIFAHHRSVLSELERGFKTFGTVLVTGSTTAPARVEAVDRFRSDPKCRVFLGQNDACGTGMDGLQYAADRLILLEPNWVATSNQQYAARLARMGQRSTTVVVQMVTLAGTLDEAIVRQHVREAGMQDTMFPGEQ